MRKTKILEVCIDSVASAVAAEKGGADRLEVCANLLIGGTTPTPAFFEEVRRNVRLPLHVMIRPRFGDFCYSEEELLVMEEELRCFLRLGADGAVFGALTPDGDCDYEAMKRLRAAAGDLSCTLHRCFDVCRDPLATLQDAISLNMQTILTSGQKNRCIDGLALLKELQAKAGEKIDIMAGAGLQPTDIPALYTACGITSFHLSGKKTVDSPMRHRNPDVSMGIPGRSEYLLDICDEARVHEAATILAGL